MVFSSMISRRDTRKCAAILGAIFLFEGFFVALLASPHPVKFLIWMGFLPGRHTPTVAGWVIAAVVAVAFITTSAWRLPAVRASLFRPSWLKLLAIGVGLVAGVLEEIAFRAMLMDAARDHGANIIVQILLSAVAFGLLHGIWALFRGSWRVGAGAVLATGTLGAALAVVYLASGRSLAPCVAAHVLLTALVEPGLVLAAVSGEMGRRTAPTSSAHS
jgi:small-conductance mechanosensitive channel